jgi:hypothetical protein
MRRVLKCLAVPAIVAAALATFGCVSAPPGGEDTSASAPTGAAVLSHIRIDPSLQDRILAMDPENVSAREVREVLARGPTPRIVNVHGGIYPVHLAMEDFGQFLVEMGYPEERIRNPRDGTMSWSSFGSSTALAGSLAWFYEREGMMPMLIGHSQGGIQTIKVLYELAGAFDDEVAVWDPMTDAPLARTTIVDPLTGRTRPVVGLSVCYASVVGAGGASMLLPNHWKMAGRLYTIPDNVDEFTGFTIGVDLLALDIGTGTKEAYVREGRPGVRNVALPPEYNHVVVPLSLHLAQDPAMRAWIDAYAPGAGQHAPVPKRTGLDVLGSEAGSSSGKYGYGPGDSANLFWAADVWHSIKKHWVLEAQRLLRARQRMLATQ